MKKFFMALLKGLGYFALYFGIQYIVQEIWIGIKAMPLGMKYAAEGLNILEPAVMEMYMQDIMQIAMESAVPSTIVANILTIAVVCLIFVCRKKKLTEALSLRKIHPRAVLPVILLGLGLNVLTTAAMSLLPESIMDSYQQASSFLTTGVDIWTVILAVVMAPLAEEVVLRGLVYTRFKKGMPVIAAMILSSLLFGLLHGHWLWALYAGIFGMVLAWTFERTKSLFVSILLHFAYNSCAMLLELVPDTAPDWTGFLVVAVAVVFVAVGLFLFLKVPKAVEPVEELAATEAPAAQTEESAQKEKTVETVEDVVEIAASVANIAAEVAEEVIENL